MEEVEILRQKTLFRYRSDNDYTLDELANNYIYFPNSKQLNDPFDASPNLVEMTQDSNELKNITKTLTDGFGGTRAERRKRLRNALKNPLLLHKKIDENLKTFIEKHGIACFSISQTNIVLWATYANNHQGIMLQFDPKLDSTLFDHGLSPIKYVNKFEKEIIFPFTKGQDIYNAFYKKHDYWKYEHEVRLVKEEVGKVNFEINALRSITFGLRTPESYKEKIAEIVKLKYPHTKLYQISISQNDYAFDFTELAFI